MGGSADRPPDGIVDVYMEGTPKDELEIELRIFPPPSPGPRLEERVRCLAGVARHCLEAADRLTHPGTDPPVGSSLETHARGTDGAGDPRVRRVFSECFELLFRRVLGDVLGEGRELLSSEERLHVNLQWGKKTGG